MNLLPIEKSKFTVLPDKVHRILAVTIGGLGDAILFSPVLKALRRRFPNAQINLLCASSLVAEAYSSCDEVDDFFIVETKQLHMLTIIFNFSIFGLKARISGGFDLMVLATGLNKNLSHLLKRTVGIKMLFCAPSFPTYETDLLCNVQLARNFDYRIKSNDVFISIKDPTLHEAHDLITKYRIPVRPEKFIAIYPSTNLLHRPRWELNKLIEVIKTLKKLKFDGRFVLIGSSEEGREWERIDIHRVVDTNLAGILSIPEIAAILKNASLTIGNDGGLVHVAGAVGCPLVAIMPNAPKAYHPAGNKTKVVRSTAKCCDGFYPKRPKSCINTKCTEDISVQKVVKACLEFL